MKKISPRGGVENNKMWMGEHLEYISVGKWPHVILFSTLKNRKYYNGQDEEDIIYRRVRERQR